MSTRVAFTLIGGRNWTGGYNYLLNLLRVLDREVPGEVSPVLLAGVDVPDADLEPFAAIAGCEVVRHARFDEAARGTLLKHAVFLGGTPEVHALLASLRIDVVFESAVFLGWRMPLPAIAWIPDLQHRFLPQLFSRQARWRREAGFQVQIRAGRVVMCSSEDTRAACETLYPACRGRVHAVRFAVDAPVARDDAQAREIAARHGAPDAFFFMPNQFWAHKNHRCVIEALDILRQRGRTVSVLASGLQKDPRDERHVPALMALLRERRLDDRFIAPGLLPYADLGALMQASLALLNPSRFEGWSTTVEEARAAGVPMVLSDIAVHREQAEGLADFFDPSSPPALADALQAFQPMDPQARAQAREAARVQARQRLQRYARDFLTVVEASRRLRL